MNLISRFEDTADSIRALQGGSVNGQSEDENEQITENEQSAEDIFKKRVLSAINKIKSLKNGSVISLPISLINLSKNQRNEETRQDEPEFLQLIESIKEVGLIHKPIITIDTDSIFPLDGHCRILAYKYLGNESISCEVRILETDDLNQLTSLIANTARKNWNIIAIAKSLKTLYSKGLTQEKLAKLIGKDRATILRLLKIASWPDEVLKIVMEHQDKITQRSILHIASRTLDNDQISNLIKQMAGLIEKEKFVKKNPKNEAKFNEIIKLKNYSSHEINMIKEVLSAFGIL